MDMLEVLEAMRLNGLHDEAAAVGIVMQQRAELLEALKLIKDHPSNDAYEIRQYAVAAITKAEATE